jgi:hypothetical protein
MHRSGAIRGVQGFGVAACIVCGDLGTLWVFGGLTAAIFSPCSLDILPLLELARQNYSAEIIKYAGGSPLSGMTAAAPVRARCVHACLRLDKCWTCRNVGYS